MKPVGLTVPAPARNRMPWSAAPEDAEGQAFNWWASRPSSNHAEQRRVVRLIPGCAGRAPPLRRRAPQHVLDAPALLDATDAPAGAAPPALRRPAHGVEAMWRAPRTGCSPGYCSRASSAPPRCPCPPRRRRSVLSQRTCSPAAATRPAARAPESPWGLFPPRRRDEADRGARTRACARSPSSRTGCGARRHLAAGTEIPVTRKNPAWERGRAAEGRLRSGLTGETSCAASRGRCARTAATDRGCLPAPLAPRPRANRVGLEEQHHVHGALPTCSPRSQKSAAHTNRSPRPVPAPTAARAAAARCTWCRERCRRHRAEVVDDGRHGSGRSTVTLHAVTTPARARPAADSPARDGRRIDLSNIANVPRGHRHAAGAISFVQRSPRGGAAVRT